MDVNTCLWSKLEHKHDQVKVAAKNISAKIFACEFWVKRVGAFGMVLYRYQCSINFILHFFELHSGSSIRYEITLFQNTFLKWYKVKRI